jgi:PII-like signaling protein
MELKGDAKLLRVFIGESDKHQHRPLYEAIIAAARRHGLAGATAWRGILSYGQSTRIRTAKVLDLSADMPVIIEMADRAEAIDGFLGALNQLLEEANCGGLITVEKVEVVRHLSERHRPPGKASDAN